jgi:type III pantothenate kinase
MMSGAVFGYRGLVREIVMRVTAENFSDKKLRVIATGGYAGLIAKKLPEIEAVHPNLTLEGLRIVANRNIRTENALQGRRKLQATNLFTGK